MQYVVSDIHGNYEKYKKIFTVIPFNKNDTLYVLGDCVDRGNDSLKILLDMMEHPNIIPIVGNHEYIALYILKKLNDHSEGKINDPLYNQLLDNWLDNGGTTTMNEFNTLNTLQKEKILKYLGQFKLYIETRCNHKDYILIHASLSNFDEARPLSSYSINELIFERANYDKIYYKDKFIVSGHTPTHLLAKNNKQQKIYKANNHIAIDCGCGFGGKLAVYCLDNDSEYYI